MIPGTVDAYNLLHEGSLAMAGIECNGIRVDIDYVTLARARCRARIERKREAMEDTDTAKEWRKWYGGSTNYNSSDQLADVLFEKMGYAPSKKTASGKASTDEDALSDIDDPFVKLHLEIKKIQKADGTYLAGIQREVTKDLIHGFFHLHRVETYRGSSSDPNLQNIPIRQEDIKQLIRTAFIPRKGRHLVEIDFKGAEVCVAACYNKDPRLIDYILDPTKDMHRDMAQELFMLPQKEIDSKIRFYAKSYFTFAQFYGDWYKSCAPNLWEIAAELKTKSGINVQEHLKKKGITGIGDLDPKRDPVAGTYEDHVRKVEKSFWYERFPVYTAWKKQWYADYQAQGYFNTLTGFTCRGYMTRNECINYGIQGSSFHCLLWTLIRLIRVELERRGMSTLIVSQIHDSILTDVPPEELHDFIALCQMIITKKLPRHWPWLIVPMTVEVEVSPLDQPWADKREWDIEKGTFKEKK